MLTFAFKQRCEALSLERRAHLRLRIFDRLPADDIIKDLKGVVYSPREVASFPPDLVIRLENADDWSANILYLKPLRILCNPNHAGNRRESNLMHEVGHVLLEHPLIPFSLETFMLERNPQHEAEASYLGGCLQIPRRGLLWAAQRGCTVAQTAEHFGSSMAMVSYRAQVTKISLQT